MIHSESFLFWGSAIGSALNVFTMWAISQGYRWGWLAALAVQVSWATFGILSGQYAFAGLAAIYSVLYWRGYQRNRNLV